VSRIDTIYTAQSNADFIAGIHAEDMCLFILGVFFMVLKFDATLYT